MQFDAANRPTLITDPANGSTTLAYDAAGNKTTVTDPTNATTTYLVRCA